MEQENFQNIKQAFMSDEIEKSTINNNNGDEKPQIYSRSEIHRAMLDATLSSLFYAFNTIVIKYTKIIRPDNFTAYNFSMWRGITSSICLYYIIRKKYPNIQLYPPQTNHIYWFITRTLGFYASFIFLVLALLCLRVSTAQVLCSIAPVVSLFVSVTMLKEKFYWRYLAGIALCFIGSAIILGTEKGNSSEATFDQRTFVIGIFASIANFVLNGSANVGQKILTDEHMSNNLQVYYVSNCLLVCSFVACILTRNFGMDLAVFGLGTLNGFFYYMANHYYQEALPVLNVGGCVPFNYLLTVFVFILCVIVLGENLFFTDILGSLVILSFHLYNAWYPIENKKENL